VFHSFAKTEPSLVGFPISPGMPNGMQLEAEYAVADHRLRPPDAGTCTRPEQPLNGAASPRVEESTGLCRAV
jgi:hypothetical protein